jgi:hypothetical protein
MKSRRSSCQVSCAAVQVQRVAEALNEGDGTAPDPPVSTSKAGPAAQRAEDDPHKYPQYLRNEGAVVSKAVAQVKGERKNPLADRRFRENAIHYMGGGVRHPAAATGCAEATPFA